MSIFPQPTKNTGDRVNPRRLLIATLPKMGKTHLVKKLEDNLILDLEDSTDYYSGPAEVFNVLQNYKKFALNKDAPPSMGMYFYKYCEFLVEKAKKEGPLYKYLTIDTASILEDVADNVALDK